MIKNLIKEEDIRDVDVKSVMTKSTLPVGGSSTRNFGIRVCLILSVREFSVSLPSLSVVKSKRGARNAQSRHCMERGDSMQTMEN